MSKSNRRKKEELIKIFGPKCFIEELKIRSPEEIENERKKYTGKKQLKIMDELTYHHILEKSKGGPTTLENGAILRNINHQWFNRLSKERQREINQLFKDYKKNFPKFKIAVVEITTEGIKQAQIIEYKEEEPEIVTIPVYDTTPEERAIYEEHKRKRNRRIFKKFEDLKNR